MRKRAADISQQVARITHPLKRFVPAPLTPAGPLRSLLSLGLGDSSVTLKSFLGITVSAQLTPRGWSTPRAGASGEPGRLV